MNFQKSQKKAGNFDPSHVKSIPDVYSERSAEKEFSGCTKKWGVPLSEPNKNPTGNAIPFCRGDQRFTFAVNSKKAFDANRSRAGRVCTSRPTTTTILEHDETAIYKLKISYLPSDEKFCAKKKNSCGLFT